MQYLFEYYSKQVEDDVLGLPDSIAARYVILVDRMSVMGPNLGEHLTKSLSNGLFEIRLSGREGIGRVFFGLLVGRRIVILHSFVKKTNKTPASDLELARKRLKEVKAWPPPTNE